MDTLLNFLANNYLIFAIASGVLLLALIGIIFAGKKKDNKKAIDPSLQPLGSNGELNLDSSSQLISDNDIINNASVDTVTPVVIANNNSALEPSLDGLESNASEVRVNGSDDDQAVSGTPMLVIDDNVSTQGITELVINDSTPAQSTPALVINDSAPVQNTPALVINDSAPVQNTPALVINDSTPVQSTPTLVINDSTPVQSTPTLVINDSTPAQSTPTLVINDSTPAQSTPTLVINDNQNQNTNF